MNTQPEYYNPNPKPKTHRDKKYLDWLRSQPCVGCDQPKSDEFDIVYTHKGGGMAIKGDDREALPLCTFCHETEHRAPKTFWITVRFMTKKSRDQHVKEHRKRYGDSHD